MSQPAAKPIPPRRSGVVVPQKPKWHGLLAARLVYSLIWLVASTTRFRLRDTSGLLNHSNEEPAIFAIWHNRLAYSLVIYHKYVKPRSPNHKLASLVSASKDGGLLARILELFETLPVRGSSSRRGAQALLEMTSAAKDGHDLAITPDGPRGPCYQVQDGIVGLAQVTGMPVVPVSYRLSLKLSLKSWDRFQIPLPFSKCEVNFGEPLRISRDATDEERAEFKAELQRRLVAMTVD